MAVLLGLGEKPPESPTTKINQIHHMLSLFAAQHIKMEEPEIRWTTTSALSGCLQRADDNVNPISLSRCFQLRRDSPIPSVSPNSADIDNNTRCIALLLIFRSKKRMKKESGDCSRVEEENEAGCTAQHVPSLTTSLRL